MRKTIAMGENHVRLIGFDDDDALDEIFSRYGLLADYKSFLPEHLTGLLQEQQPNVKIRSVELLDTPKCDLGGMPSPENQSHVIVETMKVPLELRIHLSTTGDDLHELCIMLVINAEDIHTTPRITTDMLIRTHTPLS